MDSGGIEAQVFLTSLNFDHYLSDFLFYSEMHILYIHFY